MKIGIDLRFIDDSLYYKFILQILENFIEQKKEDNFTIYSNIKIKNFDIFENVKVKKVKIKLGSLAEQFSYKKILKKDSNHIMIFFNQFKPISYKKDYITFIGTLKDFYYSNFSSPIEKYIFFFLAEKNFKNSKKIICLDKKTEDELIEKFNINSKKIELINGFFPVEKGYNYEEKVGDLGFDLGTKYQIKNDFFIYSSGSGIEKNYEKLISVFKKLKEKGKNIDLVFLGEQIGSNVNLRKSIINKKMEKNIFFLSGIKLNEKKYLLNESLGVILPSFYEPFPFSLTEAVYFNIPIISSNLKKTKIIFDDKITYFSPISENSILEKIEGFLNKKLHENKVDYSEIKEKYNLKFSLDEFIKIFDSV